MANQQLGPLEVICDAPSYSIVEACQMIGFQDPEDVRWCRMTHFLNGPHAWREFFNRQTWKSLLGMAAQNEKACSCGEKLPLLEKYTFTLISGTEISYFLGQCARCRAIFWEEA